jgi:hypothetical protein
MVPSSRNFLSKISKTNTNHSTCPATRWDGRKQEVSQGFKPLEEGEYLKKLTVSSETSPPHQTKERPFVRGRAGHASEVNSLDSKMKQKTGDS